MKAVGLGLLAALALVSAARADDEDVSDEAWTLPALQVRHDRWPKAADGWPLYGEVVLDCIHVDGAPPSDCRVKRSEPTDPKLEDAALALAPLAKGKGNGKGRAPLVISVKYDSEPDWLGKPSFGDLMLTWPRRAAAAGRGGSGAIKCTINIQGLLQNCSVLRDSSPKDGFGPAALRLAPAMLFKPATRRGKPVEAEVTIPVKFPTDASIPMPNALLINAPYWSKTPDAHAILDQLDKKVGDRFADGKVVLMCKLDKKTGKVSACSTANASAGMAQFGNVAKALSAQFRADEKSMSGIRASLEPTQTDAFVLLPFSFPDMTSAAWSKRYLSHIQWTRLLTPGPGNPLFPSEAVKAGLTHGDAVVDCLVGDEGGLTDCKPTKESVPNVGFGAMAKTIAEGSTVDRWNNDGLPVGGARVEIPIHMTYDEKLATAAKP